jgi:hypothetical protein
MPSTDSLFFASSYKNIKFFLIFCRKYDKELLISAISNIEKGLFDKKLMCHLSWMGDI